MADFFKNVVIPLIGVVTALLAGWVNYSVSTVKSKLEEQDRKLAEQKVALDKLVTERNLKKFDEDLSFRLYDAVTASLKDKDAKQQQAASALVIVMAAEPLRTQLLQVFDQARTTAPDVRTEVAKVLATEQQFRQEEEAVKQPAPAKPAPAATGSPWRDWDVDVFWCERSGEAARRQAEAVKEALVREGARGRIRARILPASINARPGYGVRNYVIRSDPGEEERAAALQRLGQAALPGSVFELQASGQATRWYLSAFICPGSAP